MNTVIFMHDIVDIDVDEKVITSTDGRKVATTEYLFTDKDGSKSIVTVFHADEEAKGES